MTTLYRILTGDDSSEFCHKVTLALTKGWMLHGSPSYSFDGTNGVMRCAQAMTKEIDGDYDPGKKLGTQ